MGAFLLNEDMASSFIRTVLWLLAPIVTAAGFTSGILLFEKRKKKKKFLFIFLWPLIGCSVGAGVVYWFSPMLIVFGMFAVGTASIVLREGYLSLKRDTFTKGNTS
jgi:hypothetical protein